MTSVERNWIFLFLAWGVSVAATLGALFIGEIMGQMPCILCWYQRIAMFPLVLVLGVAAFRGDMGAIGYAIPLSLIGLGFALYHSLLLSGVIPSPILPCQETGPSCSGDGMLIFGMPIPYLSLAAFAAICLLLLPIARKPK